MASTTGSDHLARSPRGGCGLAGQGLGPESGPDPLGSENSGFMRQWYRSLSSSKTCEAESCPTNPLRRMSGPFPLDPLKRSPRSWSRPIPAPTHTSLSCSVGLLSVSRWGGPGTPEVMGMWRATRGRGRALKWPVAIALSGCLPSRAQVEPSHYPLRWRLQTLTTNRRFEAALHRSHARSPEACRARLGSSSSARERGLVRSLTCLGARLSIFAEFVSVGPFRKVLRNMGASNMWNSVGADMMMASGVLVDCT